MNDRIGTGKDGKETNIIQNYEGDEGVANEHKFVEKEHGT